jgi:hypothetical protein
VTRQGGGEQGGEQGGTQRARNAPRVMVAAAAVANAKAGAGAEMGARAEEEEEEGGVRWRYHSHLPPLDAVQLGQIGTVLSAVGLSLSPQMDKYRPHAQVGRYY